MGDWKSKNGLVHVYTGGGKGKTTAALGVALRALGWGARVCVVQFIKGYDNIGEAHFAESFGDRFVLKQFASDSARSIDEKDVKARREEAQAAMAFAEDVVRGGGYDVVILAEINNALHYGLIEVGRAVVLVEGKPQNVELILTGRNAPREIVEAAHYVTEMQLVKHPYQKGVPAREGVDY